MSIDSQTAASATSYEALDQYIAELGIAYTAAFVRQSASRNSGEKNKSLNWRVSLVRGKYRLDTDYMQGIGHVPGYNHFAAPPPLHYESRLLRADQERAAETGTYPVGRTTLADKTSRVRPAIPRDYKSESRFGVKLVALPPPVLRDVLYSLVRDSQSVLDAPCFEEWASELGYDTDSREAERTYQACARISMDLMRLIGRTGIARLSTLFQDY